MKLNKHNHLLEDIKLKILSDEKEYVKLLKVMGNNHKYEFKNQLSIYNSNIEATACADYDLWLKRFNRAVRRGQKGIPILKSIGNKEYVTYVFDIVQTISIDKNINEVEIWKFDYENDIKVIEDIVNRYKKNDFTNVSFEKKVEELVSNFLDDKPQILLEELGLDEVPFEYFSRFLNESLKIALFNRLGVEYNENLNYINDFTYELDKLDFDIVGNFLQEQVNECISEIIKQSNLNKELTIVNEVRYNDNMINQGGSLNGIQSNFNEQQQRGNDVYGLSNNRDGIRENRRDNTQEVKQTTDVSFRQEQITLFEDEREGRASSDDTTIISGEETSKLLNGHRKSSNGVHGSRNDKIEEKTQHNRSAEETKHDEVDTDDEYDRNTSKRNDNADVLLSVDSEEVERQSTSFSFANEHSLNLFENTNDTLEHDNFNYNEHDPEVIKENYEISYDNYTVLVKASERLARNIEAIKTLVDIESNNKILTSEDKDKLANYIGWGGLADVFDETKEGQWKEARDFLKSNVSLSDYGNMRESTLTAFYTPKTVVDAIYQVIENLGFESGNILEPSCGIGNMIGSVPPSMKSSKFYGVELDSVSGRIAKQLYPQSDINVTGFENTNFSNNFFVVAFVILHFG